MHISNKLPFIVACAFLLNGCAPLKKKPVLFEEDGYLLSIKKQLYFIPGDNNKNIDRLNNSVVYSLFNIVSNCLNDSVNQQLNKAPISIIEKTDPPGIHFVDTMYHGPVTIYYKYNKNLLPKNPVFEKIEYDDSVPKKVTILVKDNYPADVYFIVSRSSELLTRVWKTGVIQN